MQLPLLAPFLGLFLGFHISFLLLDGLLSLFVFVEDLDVVRETSRHNCKCLLFLGIEVCLAAQEAEHVIEELFDTLALLDHIHENAVKSLVTHSFSSLV